MKEVIKLLNDFEKRNNISIALNIYSDGSCSVEEFWDNEVLHKEPNIDKLEKFFKETQYKLSEKGLCLSPIQVDYLDETT